uniref:NADH dehydrogenase subunit 6 n=1 Tax=Malacocephalus laevis TaxID=630738 RepID=UPI0028FC93D8|nr:NADH dehydrogenase subunit 6 [Malacocephalus laevis]WNH37767.1 NADH dehydrogenase subunit 6 [Malacocephalus laevis]
MLYVTIILIGVSVLGAIVLASSPSPVFAAVGLTLMAGMACMLLIDNGSSFLSLLFVLVYLGGMLVVFAYCVALAADAYPKMWSGSAIMEVMMGGTVVLAVGLAVDFTKWPNVQFMGACSNNFRHVYPEGEGLGLLYNKGSASLLLCVYALFVVLLVVVDIARGRSSGSQRPPNL